MENLLAFLFVSFVTVASPGPSTLFVIRQSTAGGLRAGLGAAGGLLAGDTLFLVAGSLGVASALAAAPLLLDVIKLAGALYFARLSWLMAKPTLAAVASTALPTLRTSPLGGGLGQGYPAVSTAAAACLAAQTPGQAFRAAFVLHSINVKALLFFAMLVPQFIRVGQPLASQVALILALHLVVAASVLGAYALLGASIARMAHSSVWSRLMDIAGAAVMGGLSVGILGSIDTLGAFG